jgi:NAD-dependent DNA ligase
LTNQSCVRCSASEDAGSKLDKAVALEVPVIDEPKLREMLGE